MFKKTKKIALFLAILVEVFSIGIYPVLAASIHLPSPSSVASELEKRYHVNLGSVRDMGENLNVSNTKGTAPEVMIYFDPANPKAGEKITAKASPMYFSNQNESLYYTWYLKHKNNRDNKDWNGDGEKDIKDWKIEAMRILAQGNFDPGKFHYNGNYGNDGDSYEAHYGGDNKADMPHHCYIHDFNEGINAEIDYGCSHLFPNAHGAVTGDESFGEDEEEFWGTDPTDPDTADTGNFDEANVAGLGQQEFTWNYQEGDKVGVAVEGTSMNATKYDDASNMIMWALPKNKCSVHDDSISSEEVQCSDANLTIPVCVNTENNTDLTGAVVAPYYCVDTGEDPVCVNGIATCSFGLPRCVHDINEDDIVEEVDGSNDGAEKACDVSQETSGPDPLYPPFNLPDPDCVSAEEDANNVQTGSKSVTVKGYTFTIPTTNIDIDDCLEDNLIDPREGGQATKLEINLSYLPDNPVNDPTQDDSGDNISVQSSISNPGQSSQHYKWTIEISHDGSFGGDVWDDITEELVDSDLVVGQMEGNNVSNINFRLNLNEENLGVSSGIFNNYFPDGIGYLKITAEANEIFSPGVVRYGKSDVIIKVVNSSKKIDAYGASVNSNGTLRIDNSDIICKENGKQDPICYVTKGQVIGVRVDGSNLENFSWSLNDQAMNCNSSVSSQCGSTSNNYNFFPVTGNAGDTYVVSLTADDIPSSIRYVNDTGNAGKTINLIRKFQVVKPYLSIETADSQSVWKRWLGAYKDLDGNEYDDLSSKIFETFYGSNMPLEAKFHPASIENDTAIQWTIDGYSFPDLDNKKQISIEANKEVGSTYNIDVKGLYSQLTETRKAMEKIWGISEFQSEEQYFNANIQVEVIEGSAESAKINSPKKFFAAIVKGVPDNFIFLFRLVLTVGIIIFVSGLIFSLNPNRNEIYKTKYF